MKQASQKTKAKRDCVKGHENHQSTNGRKLERAKNQEVNSEQAWMSILKESEKLNLCLIWCLNNSQPASQLGE